MKRTFGILAGLATLGVAAYVGTQLWAQQPAAQPPAAQPQPTRIGIVNMVAVLKSYKKYTNMEAELRARAQELEKKLEPFRGQLIQLQTEYKKPETVQARREQIERELRKLQVDAQDAEEQAKKELMKRSGDAYVQIYREVEDLVKRFAVSQGYGLVMFYNDAIDQADLYHPANVQRKLMQPAAVIPMYITPGMDITKMIADNLNAMYSPAASAPTGAPVGAAAPVGTPPGGAAPAGTPPGR
ncbi:MAG: OmpH family outer membrane protein [Gemmataceae bacterium]|nr:OmpH family outer membrane protein [Gemmataceae bacterium]